MAQKKLTGFSKMANQEYYVLSNPSFLKCPINASHQVKILNTSCHLLCASFQGSYWTSSSRLFCLRGSS